MLIDLLIKHLQHLAIRTMNVFGLIVEFQLGKGKVAPYQISVDRQSFFFEILMIMHEGHAIQYDTIDSSSNRAFRRAIIGKKFEITFRQEQKLENRSFTIAFATGCMHQGSLLEPEIKIGVLFMNTEQPCH